MSRFEVLSDTHKIQVADHERGIKYVFNKNHNHDGDAISIRSLYTVERTTKQLDITAAEIPQFNGVQDVPQNVFDFLDQQGYHTDTARTSYELA